MGKFDESNFSMPGARNRRQFGRRADAENYAASLGLPRGGTGWGDAIRDFIMNPARVGTAEAAAASSVPDGGIHSFRSGRAGGEEPTFEEEWQAILAREGGLYPDGSFMVSEAGAVGPSQMLPSTGPEAAKLAGLPWDPKRFWTDRAYNEALGRAYYANLRRTFDAPTAAAAYNTGPTRIRGLVEAEAPGGKLGDWENHVSDDTRDYVAAFRAQLGLPSSPAQRAYEAKKAHEEKSRQVGRPRR